MGIAVAMNRYIVTGGIPSLSFFILSTLAAWKTDQNSIGREKFIELELRHYEPDELNREFSSLAWPG